MVKAEPWWGSPNWRDIAAAERERALQAEVERLRGRCNRLRGRVSNRWFGDVGRPSHLCTNEHIEWVEGLDAGDMEPELHDGSQPTLQERIAAWARTVFPHDDPDAATGGVLAHFLEEVGEMVVAYNEGGDVREEAADIMHLLFQLAEFGGFDLLAETERKLAINRKRTWGAPDANGVVHHIRESEPHDATSEPETE